MKGSISRRLAVAALVGIATIALHATARAQVLLTDDPAPRAGFGGRLEARFLNEFDTETDGGDEFNAWRVALEGGVDGPVHESVRLGVRAAYQHADYAFHFDHAAGRPPSYGGNELPRAPWGGINTIDVAPTLTASFGEQFSLETAVPIRWSGETGANRNGLAAGVTALARWQALDQLSVGGGIGITSQLEGPLQVFPVLAFDWQILPGLDLRTRGSFVQGGQTMLLWGASDAVRLTVSAGYERNRFRLDDNGVADDRHGIGEVEAVPIEVGVRIVLFEHGYLDFRAGLAFAGRLRVENANGNRLYAENYDPAPRVGLALTIPLGAQGRASGPSQPPPSVTDPNAPAALP